MVFTAGAFFIFIAIFMGLLVFIEGSQLRYFVLCASYIFYGGANPDWLVIILVITVVDFYLANILSSLDHPGIRVLGLIISCATNLGILIWFKYSDFIMANIEGVFGLFGYTPNVVGDPVTMPIGISFFVFESLSYIVDIYRRKIRPCKRLSDYALFIAFFPHLVSGPIVRAADFLPQISHMKPFRREATISGMELIIIGFFKKAVVADNIGSFVDAVYATGSHPGGAVAWLASIGFAIQIYADFSGYTDIARGLSRIIGIELCHNFRWPYFSASPQDFWRRWHMSLSLWMRDYIYIILGGNRRGKLRMYIALFVTWFLGGLWHGAAWHFVAWGLYHGFLVWGSNVISQFWEWWSSRTTSRESPDKKSMLRVGCRIGLVALTFAAVVFGWVLFRASDLDFAFDMWRSMLGIGSQPFLADFGSTMLTNGVRGWNHDETNVSHLALLGLYVILGVAHAVTYKLYKGNVDGTILHTCPYFVRVSILGFIALATVLFQGDSRAFIYFSF